MTDGLPTETPPLLLDRYRVEAVIGEGAFGRVVRAFDARLKRIVAIKTLKRSLSTTDPLHFRILEDRFIREAEAGSRTGSHPNLVTIYDLVADADRSFFLIQEYVGGGNVADRLSARGPFPPADALRLIGDAASGLRAAHEAGIVHRDIKPANIFLARDGRAQVGDFGIAQIDRLSGRTYATIGHPGTPLYMSPEQAHSSGYIRPDSDQYSLGLVLFELVDGRPFKRLRDREAAEAVTAIPRPVADLFRRMAAHESDDRYASMADVVAQIRDAERQLPLTDGIHTSISTERSERERLADQWRSRTPEVPTPDPSDTVATSPKDTHRTRRESAQTASLETSVPGTLASIPPHPPVTSATPDTSPSMPARMTRRTAILAGVGALIIGGGTTGASLLAHRSGNKPDTSATSRSVESAITLKPPADQFDNPSTTAASPVIATTDSRQSLTAPPTDTVSPATATPSATVAPSPPPAPTVAVLRVFSGHTDRVFSVAFTPDGKMLISGSGDTTARVWRVEDGVLLHTLTGHTDIVSSVVMAPVGGLVASSSFDTTVRLWSVGDGVLLHTLTGHTNWVRGVAFTPDGQIIASCSDDKTIRLWQTKEGTLVRTLTGHTGLVSCVAISPDGRTLASGSIDKMIRLWQVSDGAPVRTLTGHTDLVSTITFSPDGKILASIGTTSAGGAGDATVRLWSIPDGELLRTLVGHTDGVISIAFSPDGKTLVTSSTDKTVRLWRTSDGVLTTTVRGPSDLTYDVIYAPDGQTFASGADDNVARLWQIR